VRQKRCIVLSKRRDPDLEEKNELGFLRGLKVACSKEALVGATANSDFLGGHRKRLSASYYGTLTEGAP